jgi:hypothetical protein
VAEPIAGGRIHRTLKEIDMQIIGTNVVGQSDGKTTVEFKGEGGELISVVLASDGLEDAAAVRRAKEMMVQVATFNVANDAVEDAGSSVEGLAEVRVEGLEETSPTTASLSSPNSVA